ncbi:GNAT family N-acetyltransferase [Streptomyces sp. MBT65]|uniref:GNAT family N-acetyltransferase n=1 Tax=Streptomyces sp. MBT65 TaxID=1488395 RepID=UPI001909B5C0|nr:GNAT family N-acetyltransferase [Streptomyces sp. MBT65]MBK3581472.1 GNAT family N-acetyltransferase [Streptomyces sp. MBT65]
MYVSEALNSGHSIQSFDCGKVPLNDWLKNSALAVERQRTSRTFVLSEDSGEVIAYYSLAAHVVAPEGLPNRIRGNARDPIPAVLLAKLALHRDHHGRGLGGALLADALERIVEAGRHVGARVVVVDAIDEEAASFYEKHGFQPMPGTDRLLRRLSSIAADLAP